MKINTNKINANKKNVIIFTIVIVMIGLGIGIGLHFFGGNDTKNTEDIEKSIHTSDVAVTVEPVVPEIIAESKVKPEELEQLESPKPTPETKPNEPNPSTTSIQEGNPKATEKPTEPPKPTPQGDVTDKIQQPSYNEEDTKPSNREPKVGDRNDKGEIYVAGFGWIKEIGESEYEVIGSDGDIDKQVGIM